MDPPSSVPTVESRDDVPIMLQQESMELAAVTSIPKDLSAEQATVSTLQLSPKKPTSPLQSTTRLNTEPSPPPTLTTPPAPAPVVSNSIMRTTSTGSNQTATSVSQASVSHSVATTKTSFLTRKAHKFSALKKKKGASQLLNKLFCNVPDRTTVGAISNGDNMSASPTMPARLSLADQTSPHSSAENTPTAKSRNSKNQLTDNDSLVEKIDNNAASSVSVSCGVSFRDALEQASDALTIQNEDQVRSTIQGSLTQAYEQVLQCHGGSDSSTDTDNGHVETTTTMALAPKTPVAALKKPMKTPGGVVIPTPAVHKKSGSLFPTTLESSSSSSIGVDDDAPLPRQLESSSLSAEEKTEDGVTVKQEEPVVAASPGQSFIQYMWNPAKSPVRAAVASIEAKTPPNKRLSLPTFGEVQAKEETKSVSSGEAPADDVAIEKTVDASKSTETVATTATAEDEDDAAFLPNDFSVRKVASATSVCDSASKSPVPTAAPPKSPVRRTASKSPVPRSSTTSTTPPAPAASPARREMGRRYTWSDMELRISEAVDHAKSEWKTLIGEEVRAQVVQEQDAKLDLALKESKSQAEELLQEHSEQWKQDHDSELKQLGQKYERKVNEQKDQSALLNRAAKSHQQEVEALENQLQAFKLAASSGPNVAALEAQVVQLVKEKGTAVRDLEKELVAVKSKLTVAQQDTADAKSKLTVAETESADVKSKLSVKEKEATTAKAHLAARDREVNETKALLVAKEKEATEAQTQLAAKAKEAAEAVAQLALVKAAPESTVKSLVANKETEMTESRYKLPNKGSNDSSKSMDSSDLKTKLASKEREATDLKSKLTSIEKEVIQVKTQLSNKEKEASEFKTKLSTKEKDATESKAKTVGMEKEIGILKAKLTASEKEADSFKDKLAAKEQELKVATPRTTTPNRRFSTSSPGRSASRLTKPNATPTRSPYKSPARGGSAIKTTGSGLKSRRETEPTDTSTELHEREKESLRTQIATLEEQVTKSGKEHERALQHLRTASEAELFQVKKDMENRLEHHMTKERELKETLSSVNSCDKEELLEKIESLEAEKKADRNGGLREVQKKEDLLQRIATLERMEKALADEHQRNLQDVRNRSETEIRKLKQELEQQREDRIAKERELNLAISETSSFEKEELLVQVEKLESKLAGEKSGAVLIKLKITAMEKELQAEEKNHQEEVEQLRAKTNAEVKRLETELAGLSTVKEEFDAAVKESGTFMEQVEKLRTDIEGERTKHKHKFDNLRIQHMEEVDDLKQRTATEIETVHKDLESARKDADERIAKIEKEKELIKDEVVQEFEIISNKSSTDEKGLRSRLQELEEQVTGGKEDFELKLLAVNKDHEFQLDELLKQLDLVEAEHKEKMAEKDKATTQKDAIITALGSQLADADVRTKAIEETHQKLTDELTLARDDATKAKQDTEKIKAELVKAKDSHDAFMMGEVERRESACEEAREEMIERAEVQFKSANDLYVKLKKEYDASMAKVDKVESELKSAKRSLDAGKREQEDRVADMKAEVAQLKAGNAKTESDAAHKSKDYRREMEGLLNAAKDFEAKLEDAESMSRSLEKSLSAVVAGKTKLQKEYDDMKNVCEELMVMVEGQQPQRHEC